MPQTARYNPSDTTVETLGEDLQGLSVCWQPRAPELHDFLMRWEEAWNAHDLDALEAMVGEDIAWEDPAMHGNHVHGRTQFRAFSEIFFKAFPDVAFEGDRMLFVDMQGDWLAVRWRMTGTFSGELQIWGAQLDAGSAGIKPNGSRFSVEAVDLYQLRDGLLANYCTYYDLLGFSQQLGLLS